MYDYPLPTAEPDYIRRVIDLYRREYGMELGYDEAKEFLERVAHFTYLTEVEPALEELRRSDDDDHHDPVVDGGK